MLSSPSRRHVSLLLSMSFAFLIAACGADVQVGSDGDASGAASRPELQQQRSVVSTDAAQDNASSREMAPAPPPSPQPGQPPVQPGTGGSTVTMIIRTGSAVIEVDSLEPAVAAVQRMATALGGIVGNTSLSSGEYEVRTATIELRIPAARFNEALEGLRPLGKVESVQSHAQDVSEEFVDVSARVANARRLEERLIALLANRAGKLEEVLAVERELARVREEIERYEGRIRYLQTRVATSTLTITVHEARPLVSNTPGQNVIAEAFRQAWRNFVSFVAWFIASLGVLIPLAIVVAPVVYGVLRLQRRQRRPPSGS